MLDHFAAAGGTFIATADVYSKGVKEEFVGRWLGNRADAERFIVATKGLLLSFLRTTVLCIP